MISAWMVKVFGASWKPTVMGIITFLFGFVAMSPELFPHWVVELSKYVALSGGLGVGITAKGASVTGGSTPNTQNDPLIVKQTLVHPAGDQASNVGKEQP